MKQAPPLSETYFTEFERLYREYDEQLYANGLDKLEEKRKFLESYKLLN